MAPIRRKKSKKTGNQKVKNATPIIIDGIQFRSKLEGHTYTALRDNKIKALYEPIKFELIPGFTFNGSKKRPMTYTPDFVGKDFIIEAKGRANDAFPNKWKLFMYYLTQNNLKYDLYLVHNKKEIQEMIDQLKNKKL